MGQLLKCLAHDLWAYLTSVYQPPFVYGAQSAGIGEPIENHSPARKPWPFNVVNAPATGRHPQGTPGTI